jgi:hypothetical protein
MGQTGATRAESILNNAVEVQDEFYKKQRIDPSRSADPATATE